MPSPFPGMDPWLEDPAGWLDIHSSIIAYLRDDLNERLGSGYFARCNERVVVESLEGRRRGIYPDVALVQKPSQLASERGTKTGGTAVIAEPVHIRVPTEGHREAWVEIRERKGGRLVTSIEFLSLGNKTTGESGRELYLKKQREVLASTSNLVEIDLLRAGEWTVALPEGLAPAAGEFDYVASVSRATDRSDFEIYPIRLSERLLVIGIPLAGGDADVPADLQSLVTRAYDRGRYGEVIDYQADPVPPLRPTAAAWAHGLLRAAGRRK